MSMRAPILALPVLILAGCGGGSGGGSPAVSPPPIRPVMTLHPGTLTFTGSRGRIDVGVRPIGATATVAWAVVEDRGVPLRIAATGLGAADVGFVGPGTWTIEAVLTAPGAPPTVQRYVLVAGGPVVALAGRLSHGSLSASRASSGVVVHLAWAPDPGEPWARMTTTTVADGRWIFDGLLPPPSELVVGIGAPPRQSRSRP